MFLSFSDYLLSERAIGFSLVVFPWRRIRQKFSKFRAILRIFGGLFNTSTLHDSSCPMKRCLLALLLVFTIFPLNAQTNVQTSATLISCACGTNATTLLTSTEAEARRGVPAFIVLRGQRFGGSFGEAVGGTQGLDIPLFPSYFGSQIFGGGISTQTALQYGALIGPFKAGLPTVATIVAEVVDIFGDVVTTVNSTNASLELGALQREDYQWFGFSDTPVLFPGTNIQYRYLQDAQLGRDGILRAEVKNGRVEWQGVNIVGRASTSLTLSVRHSTIATCGCAVQVSLQGGYSHQISFANQKRNFDSNAVLVSQTEGPFAVPGNVAVWYRGSASHIIVGQAVTFPSYSDETGYSSITGIIRDRFGNFASFHTQATLSISGGSPPVDNRRTWVIGNTANSRIEWGLGRNGQEAVPRFSSLVLPDAVGLTRNIAALISPAVGATGSGYPPVTNLQVASHLVSFPNFSILGATSNNVSLVLTVQPDVSYGLLHIGFPIGNPYGSSATVNLLPAPAIAIAPVLIPDTFNRNLPARIPSAFYIGRSNAGDRRQWFYLQAVDEFGNRADRGPNAYNQGTATITFQSPERGLPRAASLAANAWFPPNGFQFLDANDPHVKANNQRYSATGTTATAVNGLYTFNNFTPLGPSSIDPLGNDVVLTFEDVNLSGLLTSRCACAFRYTPFQPAPPITTATTTFRTVPKISFSIPEAGEEGAATNGSVRLAENVLVMRERSPTYLTHRMQPDFQRGAVRVQRPLTAAANDIAVGYTLRYLSLDSTVRVITSANIAASQFLPTPRTFDLPNVGRDSVRLPAPLNIPNFLTQIQGVPAPSLVRINGLQGDLSPMTRPEGRPQSAVNVAPEQLPGTLFLDAGVTRQLLTFTARWSDQVWSWNPGQQGLRAVVMSLRNPDDRNATFYEVDRTLEKDSAFVFLLDPADVPPVVVNAIQDKIWGRNGSLGEGRDRLELESLQWRPDSIPGWVFYDDNYDPIIYSATSSNFSKVSVYIEQLDPRFQGRPSLYYTIQPTAIEGDSARITVFAFDGTRDNNGVLRMAVDDFIIYLRSSLMPSNVAHTIETRQQLSISPNPINTSNEEASVRFMLDNAGDVRVEVYTMQGARVASIHAGFMPSGEQRCALPVAELPSGVYAVRVLAAGRVQVGMMTVVR